MRPDLAQKAEMLRSLHHKSQPLVLPNAWDVATALVVEAAGFPVVATSSFAVAESLGQPDSDSMPPDLAFGVVSRVANAVTTPVTADLEAGYQLQPEDLVARILESGAVGCNFEDTDHHGSDAFVPIERQAERLRAVRQAADAAGVPLVINARIDLFLRGSGDASSLLEEAVQRGKAYLDAGADCLYPIGLTDAGVIEAFVRAVQAPVNIWLRPDGPSRQQLSELGVARISLAAGLFRRALGEFQRAVEELGVE
jgi:2-methylisocitrate lyase-like PEP mutase family enzyme